MYQELFETWRGRTEWQMGKNYSEEGKRVQNMPPQNKSLASGLFGADYLEKWQARSSGGRVGITLL